MSETCERGHVRDEHGGDPLYPGATECTIDSCHCLMFEALPSDDEDDEGDEP